ncbi:PLD nuclease N-terminal domain-containing protein [Sinomonas sp. ASV322]|uniref:PLD nuclease N-terminal domain-containing protein n=1 Tax=Sinomonas sp. ASV322 TaxID=3041920 RepID=UPI0027DB936C|nr:PLD nuclease N-terminal domain-containing protein [Sinomonas sp. ASV322]MDQ4501919.1 PLD nuclease N-terminal domain-containing protein [Sinomonas sp. ASV322]
MARRTKKKWKDLSPGRRFGVALAAGAELALKVLAWRDLARRQPDEVHGPKAAWFAATFVNTFGPIAYFLFGRKRPASTPVKVTHR